MRPPPAARYCADNHTLAGVDYVGGVGTCCTNKSSDDAKCVAPVPDCFHHIIRSLSLGMIHHHRQ